MQRRLCLNLATLDGTDMETQLRVSRDAGFKAVGFREKQVKAFLESGRSLKNVREILDEHGLTAVEYDFFPNWIHALADERGAVQTRFRDFCGTASELGCPVLVAPTSFEGRNNSLDYDMAADNLKEMARIADDHDCTVGIEFLPWSPFNSISRARELLERVAKENVGIVLDTFHYFEGPHSRTELEKIPIELIVLVHIDDVEAVDADIQTKCREHRVLPGEGSYPFDEVLSYLAEHSYEGYYSLEILNPELAAGDPATIAREAMRSMERLLGSVDPA